MHIKYKFKLESIYKFIRCTRKKEVEKKREIYKIEKHYSYIDYGDVVGTTNLGYGFQWDRTLIYKNIRGQVIFPINVNVTMLEAKTHAQP